MTPFAHLLAPGRIGALEVPNRIVLCPMGDNLGDDGGFVSERTLAYFEARARGRTGLLLVGSVAVAYPSGTYDRRQLGLSDDGFLPGLEALTERAHRHGSRIAAQLVHDGPSSLADIAAGRPLLVPSPPGRPRSDPLAAMVTADELTAMLAPFTAPTAKLAVQVATDDDLAWVIERFADAAARAQRAGFDGVEVHAGHGYLLDAFLSPATNRREDGWGGDVDGRARLLREVLGAIRGRVGDGLAVWCRFNGREVHREGGETLDDALAVAQIAVAAGAEALHVSAYADPNVAIGITDAHTPHRPGALVELAAAVKATIDVPIITFGRLEPDDAERALADGKADFVAFGRKLLADPDLPRKLAEGRVDDVRPCIYAYRCIGNIFVGEPVGCVANPATGREGDLVVPLAPPDAARRVVVVGGGPAGMEAARLLADAGHSVALWEAAAQLGGRLALAARVDPSLDRLLGWLRRGVDHSGVELRLGMLATAPHVLASGADAVLVATGAQWPVPHELHGHPAARSVDELHGWLDDDDGSVGDRVLVVGANVAGLGLADVCRQRGHHVTVVDEGSVAGAQLGLPGRFRRVHDLQEAGVVLTLGAPVGADALELADTVLVALPQSPSQSLAHDLQAAGIEVRAIGDVASMGYVEEALRSATEAARQIARSGGHNRGEGLNRN